MHNGAYTPDEQFHPRPTDGELVKRAITHCNFSSMKDHQRWYYVTRVFGVGSTIAAALCREHHLDPDEILE